MKPVSGEAVNHLIRSTDGWTQRYDMDDVSRLSDCGALHIGAKGCVFPVSVNGFELWRQRAAAAVGAAVN